MASECPMLWVILLRHYGLAGRCNGARFLLQSRWALCRRRLGRDPLDRGHEAVTTPWKGLNVMGIFSRIAQRFSELVHSGVETVVEVNKGVRRPESVAHLVARDQLPRTAQKHRQDFKWLTHQLQARPMLPQFMRVQVNLERPKARAIRFLAGHFYLSRRRGNTSVWVYLTKAEASLFPWTPN